MDIYVAPVLFPRPRSGHPTFLFLELPLVVYIGRVKYKKRNHNDGHNDFLLNCSIGWKKHTADLALKASRFSQTLLKESFTSKWRLSFKVETWKSTKNKLLKLGNSTKADFLFIGLNMNIIIQKKKF